MIDTSAPGVRLFVGGHAGHVQGELEDLGGDRCFSAAHRPQRTAVDGASVTAILDSGAFSDRPEARLTPEAALTRQLRWEEKAAQRWGTEFQAEALVSYDYLIDETWVAGEKHKRRWNVASAEVAVQETVENARYLASQRAELYPRKLMLACQGVDALQYEECVLEVLRLATPEDWIGLGGWCILGRFTSWLPTFWATLYCIMPRIERAGVSHVHILGVLYQPALGGLLWLADQHGITVSTDSAAPILVCTWKGEGKLKKSGARMPYWKDNVKWWVDTLANLRLSHHYKRPPQVEAMRQLTLFNGDVA